MRYTCTKERGPLVARTVNLVTDTRRNSAGSLLDHECPRISRGQQLKNIWMSAGHPHISAGCTVAVRKTLRYNRKGRPVRQSHQIFVCPRGAYNRLFTLSGWLQDIHRIENLQIWDAWGMSIFVISLHIYRHQMWSSATQIIAITSVLLQHSHACLTVKLL